MVGRALQFVALAALLLAAEANNHDLLDGITTNTRTSCRRANEIYSSCGKNSCQNTCRRPTASLGCTSTACIPGCICAPGFLRSTRHTCVLPSQCNSVSGLGIIDNDILDHKNRVCGANEVFSNCGQDGCRRTCNRLDVTNCNPVCTVPSCVCAPGFVRSSDGLCVLPSACPVPTTQCSAPNEVFSQCGNDGCQRTCSTLNVAGCVSQCRTPACVCVPGFVRNAAGVCVLPSACPAMGCSGPNEIFAQCGNDGCQRTCNRLDVTGCVSVCSNPACVCAPGFVRNAQNVCVLPSTCPTSAVCTGANEEFSQCGNTVCQVTCSFTAAQAASCTAACNSGCICAAGFLRNYAGLCVPTAQCTLCPANEQFRSCGNGVCENTCATPDFTSDPRCSTAGACTSRCFCNPGMVRNSAGLCVARTQC